jgi:hypothetical protein
MTTPSGHGQIRMHPAPSSQRLCNSITIVKLFNRLHRALSVLLSELQPPVQPDNTEHYYRMLEASRTLASHHPSRAAHSDAVGTPDGESHWKRGYGAGLHAMTMQLSSRCFALIPVLPTSGAATRDSVTVSLWRSVPTLYTPTLLRSATA